MNCFMCHFKVLCAVNYGTPSEILVREERGMVCGGGEGWVEGRLGICD